MSENDILSYSEVKKIKYPYSHWLKTPVIKGFFNSGDYVKYRFEDLKHRFTCLDIGGRSACIEALKPYCHHVIDDDMKVNIAPTKHLYYYDLIYFGHSIEHFDLRTFKQYMDYAKTKMSEKSHLVITTPNAYWPNHIKYDHITNWDMMSLYCVVSSMGFNCQIYRLNRKMPSLLAKLKKANRALDCYFYDIDFNCEELVLIATLKK